LPSPGDIAYGVGKAAAVYMTKQIAVDFAKRNITCNAVAPGKIVTGCDSDVRQYVTSFTASFPGLAIAAGACCLNRPRRRLPPIKWWLG